MNIQITARKFTARETLKELIREEVLSLQKFSDEILDAEIILSYQNVKESIKVVELIVKLPGTVLTATDESDEYAKSVKATVEKIQKQIVKRKSKREAVKKIEPEV
jgi:ribosomal subunit interface protein